jgi:hypothetical protein
VRAPPAPRQLLLLLEERTVLTARKITLMPRPHQSEKMRLQFSSSNVVYCTAPQSLADALTLYKRSQFNFGLTTAISFLLIPFSCTIVPEYHTCAAGFRWEITFFFDIYGLHRTAALHCIVFAKEKKNRKSKNRLIRPVNVRRCSFPTTTSMSFGGSYT